MGMMKAMIGGMLATLGHPPEALTVTVNAESRCGDGLKSVKSCELDAFMTADKFWELFEATIRASPGQEEGKQGFEIKDLSDLPNGQTGFLEITMYEGGLKTFTKHIRDTEKDDWRAYNYGFDDTMSILDATVCTQVYREPSLRV